MLYVCLLGLMGLAHGQGNGGGGRNNNNGEDFALDANGDGIITEEEFCEGLQTAITSLRRNQNDDEEFIQSYCDYVQEYGKLEMEDYAAMSDLDKLVRRYQKFKANKKRFARMQAKVTVGEDGKEFVEAYGVNKFADQTDEDWQNMVLHDDDEQEADGGEARRLYGYIDTMCTKIEGQTWAAATDASSCWKSVEANCPTVKDQGSTSLCWSYAATSQAECNYKKQTGVAKVFSPAHVADCTGSTSGSRTGGGWAYKVLYELKGFCPNYAYEWTATSGTEYNNYCNCNEAMKKGTCYQVDFTQLNTNEDNVWTGMVRAAQIGYAYEMAMYVDNDFKSVTGNVFDGACSTEWDKGLHYMTVVGQYYGSYILLKNSWGADWGENGYVWVSKGAYMRCSKKYGTYSNRWGVFWLTYSYGDIGTSDMPALPDGVGLPDDLKHKPQQPVQPEPEPMPYHYELPNTDPRVAPNLVTVNVDSFWYGIVFGMLTLGLLVFTVINVKKCCAGNSTAAKYKRVSFNADTETEVDQI